MRNFKKFKELKDYFTMLQQYILSSPERHFPPHLQRLGLLAKFTQLKWGISNHA
jgi:hypothetical protein